MTNPIEYTPKVGDTLIVLSAELPGSRAGNSLPTVLHGITGKIVKVTPGGMFDVEYQRRDREYANIERASPWNTRLHKQGGAVQKVSRNETSMWSVVHPDSEEGKEAVILGDMTYKLHIKKQRENVDRAIFDMTKDDADIEIKFPRWLAEKIMDMEADSPRMAELQNDISIALQGIEERVKDMMSRRDGYV